MREWWGIWGISGKFVGINYALLPNCEWNQKQKHKKQPWGNVECFAFGGATVRFASLETSFHAANHTIPPPPSYEGYPFCPKDKNRSPFHGEKPLVITWFLGKNCIKCLKTITNIWVEAWYFAYASNDWYSIWYHNYGRTWSITSLPGLVFHRRRAFFILLAMPPPSLGRAALVMWCGRFKHLLEIRHATALTTGAKHWHR